MKTHSIAGLVLLLAALAIPPQASAQVSVEAEIAQRVVDRMPVDAGTSFAVDVGEVFCWTLVTGAADTELRHIWIHGEMEFPVTVQVGGSPWRTWTSKTIPPEWAGEWRVEIRDVSGNLLDTRSFTVGS